MKSVRPTIKDIAKAVNLSTSTVSRALNGHPNVKKETNNSDMCDFYIF